MAFSFFSNHVIANIDESQTDLYYANGMLMDLNKVDAQRVWDRNVDQLKQQNPKKFKNVNAKMSYNSSAWCRSALCKLDDGFEAFLQWSFGQGIGTITWNVAVLFNHNEYVEWALNQVNLIPELLNITDISTQVNAYKQSIKDGHGVIVVAHSQGNFFTNKAYQLLDPWMRSYFNMIGVASPAATVVKNGPRISFDNDAVALLSLIPDMIENPNRSQPDLPGLTFHLFDYYMGESVFPSITAVSTNVARDMIEAAILNGVDAHHSAASQWKKTSDSGCFCSDKSITVAHKFESDLDHLMSDVEVYEFNKEGKVYPVSGRHVLALLGGESMKILLLYLKTVRLELR